MTPPIETRTSSVVAVIDADEFARAQDAPETIEFWRQVDAYENQMQQLALDHAPTVVSRA